MLLPDGIFSWQNLPHWVKFYLTQIGVWFFLSKKGISYFKGGGGGGVGNLVRVPCSEGLSEGSDLRQQHCFDLACTLMLLWYMDKHHWKKMPLLFFSQNILNWRNVKIFSRTFLPLPQDLSSWDKITFYKHQVEILIMASICSVLSPEASIWTHKAFCWLNTLKGCYGIIWVFTLGGWIKVKWTLEKNL